MKGGLGAGQDPEFPVPLHVRQAGRVPEPFGEGITVDLQFGDLENTDIRCFTLLLTVFI